MEHSAPAGVEPGNERGADSGSPSAVDCVVCNDPITGRVYTLGDRSYCDQHYALAFQHRGTWPTVWILFAGLVAFALLMQRVGPALTPLLTGGALVVAGLIMAVLPALIWLFVFRRLDRLEPEGLHHLLGVMILGGLIGGAVGDPLRRGVYGMHLWSESRWMWAIPIYTLTQGLLLALTIYLTVRFSVFLIHDFDERADGVIYGTAAGLGVAVFYNIRYLMDAGALRLDVGVARIIIAALVFASVGGLIGYGLGQVRFEPHSVWYLPGIVLLAAILTGVYEWLASETFSRSLGYTAWISLLIAAAFGAILFGVINVLVRSAIRETLAGSTGPDVAAAQ
jgi:RsiW-degrading membrane proteinase PrsW (M82 family)